MLVLVISFAVSNFSAKDLFLGYSPNIRPNLKEYLIAKYDFTPKISNFIAGINVFKSLQFQNNNQADGQTDIASNTNQNTDLNYKPVNNNSNNKATGVFKEISKGVYASDEVNNKNEKEIQLRLNEVKWAKQSTIVNGKECSVNFPEGVELPKNILEKICN